MMTHQLLKIPILNLTIGKRERENDHRVIQKAMKEKENKIKRILNVAEPVDLILDYIQDQDQDLLQENPTIIFRMETKRKLMSYEEELEEGFICNINYELMNDPVLAEDGKYYEREAIVEWMKKKKESPITREPLTGKLFPDPELKLRIECYRELHPERQ
ncbi:MAG: hypothetical protein EZS28_004606 [Streblomastix strix]|uniref:U-box domain-containing protein n=1 Tax=Streblomastix strix TaxID=222440 RepID=A0A5J4WZT7_9EUKA|nr:MAG: hypothetical protein EZS28_004606 [Streblomastix strix]